MDHRVIVDKHGHLIYRGTWTPLWCKTRSMYVSEKTKADAMPLNMARRGLCARAAGSTQACRTSCGKPCGFGLRCIELEDQKKKQEEDHG